jgi:hypothetical protein
MRRSASMACADRSGAGMETHMVQIIYSLRRPLSAGCIGNRISSLCPALAYERSGHFPKELY